MRTYCYVMENWGAVWKNKLLCDGKLRTRFLRCSNFLFQMKSKTIRNAALKVMVFCVVEKKFDMFLVSQKVS